MRLRVWLTSLNSTISQPGITALTGRGAMGRSNPSPVGGDLTGAKETNGPRPLRE